MNLKIGVIGFGNIAKAIITPEDVDGKRKPDPAGLNEALSKTSIRREESVYVGDNWRDIEAAHNSGIDSILALYGYIDKKDSILLKPTSKIDSIQELKSYF